MKALGIIEVYSFSTAVCVADAAAKAGGVEVIAFDRNRPGANVKNAPAPLVMNIKLSGTVSDVKAAVEAGVTAAKERNKYIVSHVIPNPGENMEKMAYLLDINREKYNKKLPKSFLNYEGELINQKTSAIGLLEVQGLVATIEGLDTMLKTAAVRLIHTERRLGGGGLCTFVIEGSVDAVTASVEAGCKSASAIGKTFGCEVIAKPHEEVTKFFDFSV